MNQFPDQHNRYYRANIHTALGDYEAAFNALELAYEMREPTMMTRLKIDPKFAPLRTDPRFDELLRRPKL